MVAASDSEGGRLRLPLAWKLAASLLALAVVMLVFLLFYQAPRITSVFLKGSERIIERGTEAMRVNAHEDTLQNTAVLGHLIRHTTDARRRMLADMPLTLYGGDVDRIRAAVLQRDAQRSQQLQSNVEVLAREMEGRAIRRANDEADQLRREQESLTGAIAEGLRRSFTMLSGSVLLASILLLGLGLHFAIIRPLRALRSATHAVAGGDLSVTVLEQAAVGSSRPADEVAALSADFARMVQRLRSSQQEIQAKNQQLSNWNRTLEAEVDRKSRELIHAAKMASLGTLAGGIAHEFNNLIGGIRGCAREALRGGTMRPEQEESLTVILRATDRAVSITDQLLRFARQRIGERTQVRLDQLLGEVLALVEPQAKQAGVEIQRSLQDDLAVHADSSALHQVFLNLCANSLQAMPDGGTLSVEARRAGHDVVVRVTDTGVGILPEDLDRVFEPFFTGRSGGGPQQEGTGLGLSVSYGIVEAHGGTMTVESRVGRGTSFSTCIPIAGTQSAVTEKPDEPAT